MRKVILVLMFVVAIAVGGVKSGTAHYDDALDMSMLISNDFRSSSFEVYIAHQSGSGYSYHVLFDGSYTDSDATNKFIAAVLSCALISQRASWTSNFLFVGYLDGSAFSISTSDTRYVSNNIDSRGARWALDYILDNSTML